jgi:predicted RNase H-like HicB family nuclease
MFSYRAAYRLQLGTFFAEVSGFPEASAIGATLSEARTNLIFALRFPAETRLRRGDLLPLPAAREPGDAYMTETLTLLPQAGDRIDVQVGTG